MRKRKPLTVRKPPLFDNHPVPYEEAQKLGVERAIVMHIVDGDTWDLLIDLGYGEYSYKPIRLVGPDPKKMFDVYELGTPKGDQARQFCIEEFLNQPVLLKSYRDQQTFERWLGQISLANNSVDNVTRILREGGFEKA